MSARLKMLRVVMVFIMSGYRLIGGRPTGWHCSTSLLLPPISAYRSKCALLLNIANDMRCPCALRRAGIWRTSDAFAVCSREPRMSTFCSSTIGVRQTDLLLLYLRYSGAGDVWPITISVTDELLPVLLSRARRFVPFSGLLALL